MLCPECQTVNPDGAKFCMNCGHTLALACPNCGTELPASAAFCFNCGHQLAGARAESAPSKESATHLAEPHLQQYIPKELLVKLESARQRGSMEGERRIVTMLFCDIKGSTAAAEKLDPEDWADIINGAFEHIIPPVYRYEGTVARLMGDAILAFFGAPIAHEDDPQRAVLAGLDILDGIQPFREQIMHQWSMDFNVRVGINTGLVVVGAVGSDLRMEYTALGDAINVASRMEQTAIPGSVQIAEATYRLVAPLFDVEELGEISIKGKAEPVRAYRVLRQKSEPGRLRGLEGLRSPLVGRDSEMHALRGAIIELRQGRGQLVSVMGEAGLGKSRLIAELREMPAPVSRTEEQLLWLEGRSLSYQTTTPYAPFADLLGSYFQLDDEGNDEENYARIVARIAEVNAERTPEIAPFIASLLGIGLSGEPLQRVKYLEPPQLRARVFQATGDLIEILATNQPIVLVFDDLHWVDPTSLELLEQLMPITDRAQLLIIAIFRPVRHEPSWRFHETASRDFAHRYIAIQLQPLDEDSSRELVGNLLHVEDLPLKVRELILSKAEGNPFFVEEVIRSLIDSQLIVRQNGHWRAQRAIEKIAVPDNLAAVITTRLDQLDEEARRVAQTAAVLGRQFQFDALAAIYMQPLELEGALTDLQRRELIREKSRIPQRIYQFKHALTQETAYQSLLLKTRRQLHQLVAEYLEQHAAEHVNEIARHFMDARQPGRALPYLVEAADRAARAYSTAEAIGYYQAALDILGENANSALSRRVYEGLGSALTFANEVPRAVETYQKMLSLAEASADIPMQVSALNKLSYISALRMGQFQEAQRFMTEADQRARQHDDKAGLSELGLLRCMMCTAAADFEGVIHYMDELMDLGRTLGEQEQLALSLAHMASSQVFLLRFEDAWETAQEGLQLSREIGDRVHEGDILATTLPLFYLRAGDLEAARTAAEQGLEIALQINSVDVEPGARRSLGIIAHMRGEYERALEMYECYLQSSQAGGFIWHEAEAMCLMGSVYLDISPTLSERMVELHKQALKLMELPGGTMLGGTAWTELGFCAQALGNVDMASDYFQKGLTVPTITINLERPRALVGAARIALEQGGLAEADGLIREARRFAEENGMKNHYPLIALTEAAVRVAQGDLDAAQEGYRRALDLARTMNLRPLIWQAQAGLSRVMAALENPGEAGGMRQEARATIYEIAELFTNDELRTLFIENTRGKMDAVWPAGMTIP